MQAGLSLAAGLAVALASAGCVRVGGGLPAEPASATEFILMGRVDFGPRYRVAATPAEIGTAATVSLIDPDRSKTIATTLTTPEQTFSLTIRGFVPQLKTYYLEAVKGLKSNLVGHDAVRLRSLVQWDGRSWRALTTGDASLGAATTALSAIVALRAAFNPVDPAGLIGKLTLGETLSFDSQGTGVSPDEFDAVRGLVSDALGADRDPIEAMLYDGATYRLKDLRANVLPPFISDIAPNPSWPGRTITIRGGNFQDPPGANLVSLSGIPLTVVGGSAQTLVAELPSNARSGLIGVVTSGGQTTADLAVVASVEGGLLAAATGDLPAGEGLDMVGSVFSRLGPQSSPFGALLPGRPSAAPVQETKHVL